jgi:hypothetical protein
MSLISTSDLRTWLAIEEGDKKPNAKLESVSKVVQDFVDNFTNRKIEAARYNSHPEFTYLDGTGHAWIYVPQYPLSWVNWIGVDADRAWGDGTEIGTDDIFYYPSGKIVSEGGNFISGRRNVKVDYIAGYAPIVGGTHNSAISTYPLPYDLQQVMIEMTVECFKEGMLAVHTIQGIGEYQPRFIQMMGQNSYWMNTLNKYKAFDASLQGRDE